MLKKKYTALIGSGMLITALSLSGCGLGSQPTNVPKDPSGSAPTVMSEDKNADATSSRSDKNEANSSDTSSLPLASKKSKTKEAEEAAEREDSNHIEYGIIDGSDVEAVCPYCGTANTKHLDTCEHCGVSLVA